MKKVLTTIVFILISNYLFALIPKPDFRNSTYWVSAGMGVGAAHLENIGFSGSLGLTVKDKTNFYRVRNLSFYAFDLFNICTDEFYNDVSLLFGKGIHEKYGSLLFFAGPGIIFGNERDKLLYKTITTKLLQCSEHYSKRFFMTPSINLEVELILKPIKYFGIGISAYGNANLKHPLGGVSVSISIGNLRG